MQARIRDWSSDSQGWSCTSICARMAARNRCSQALVRGAPSAAFIIDQNGAGSWVGMPGMVGADYPQNRGTVAVIHSEEVLSSSCSI
jgi:hypothetical protein